MRHLINHCHCLHVFTIKQSALNSSSDQSMTLPALRRPPGADIDRGVVVNFDLGERFPRPRSQQRGSLRPPPRTASSRAGGGGGRGSPLPAEVLPPEIFFYRFLMPNPAFGGQFGPQNKLIEGQPNEYEWFAVTLQCWRSTCGQRYLPERRSSSNIFAGTAFHRVPAPLHPWVSIDSRQR